MEASDALSPAGHRILKSTGEPDRIMGLSLDITERKLREAGGNRKHGALSGCGEAFDGHLHLLPDYDGIYEPAPDRAHRS